MWEEAGKEREEGGEWVGVCMESGAQRMKWE